MTVAPGHILIADDDDNLRFMLGKFLKEKGWIVTEVCDGREALRNARTNSPDIILLDIKMPVLDGIKACQLIKNDVTSVNTLPVIMMTGINEKKIIVAAINAGCDDFILKPFTFTDLLKKIETLTNFYKEKRDKETIREKAADLDVEEASIITSARDVAQTVLSKVMDNRPIPYEMVNRIINKMVETVQQDSILPLAYKIKSYHDYTYIHSVNVASLSISFAHYLQWNEEDIVAVGEGGLFHDIGKVMVGLQILMKPGKLTDGEFAKMKRHPLFSYEILDKQGGVSDEAKLVALQHHEKMNGTGYPFGISKKKISKYGRLAAIVDVYDAMTTDKCYHRAMYSDEALAEMEKMSGQFDPVLLKLYTTLVKSEMMGK